MTAVVRPITENSQSFRRCRESLRALHDVEVDFPTWMEWNRIGTDPHHNRFRIHYLGTINEHQTLFAVKVGGVEKTDFDDRWVPLIRNRRNGAFVDAMPASVIDADQAETLAFLSNRGQQAFQKTRADVVEAYGLNYLTLEEWMELCKQCRTGSSTLVQWLGPSREIRRAEIRRGAGQEPEILPVVVEYDPTIRFVTAGGPQTVNVLPFRAETVR